MYILEQTTGNFILKHQYKFGIKASSNSQDLTIPKFTINTLEKLQNLIGENRLPYFILLEENQVNKINDCIELTDIKEAIHVNQSVYAVDECIMEDINSLHKDSNKATLTIGKEYKILEFRACETFHIVDDSDDLHSFNMTSFYKFFKTSK